MNKHLNSFLSAKLTQLEAKQLKREPKTTMSEGVYVFRGDKKLINFSSNDYLGLAHNEQVKEAARKAVAKYGAGAAASRLITGNHPLYDELEGLIAEYNNTENACVFGSGYMANIGAIPALVDKADLIIADKLAHACIIDGSILSGSEFKRFKHNDIEALKSLLQKHRNNYRNCLIITEGVFSMDGDKAPMQKLKVICEEFNCWLMVDNAHLLEKPEAQADIIMGTLSKAHGSYGGYVAGSKELTEYLKSSARSFIFTTGLPPSVVAAASESYKILKVKDEVSKQALDNANYFCKLLNWHKPESQIVPVILNEVNVTLEAQRKLFEAGILVHAIRPPTVPEGTARLRISFTALHENWMIEKLAEEIKKFIF